MPVLFAASESIVLIDGQAVEGVRSIDYRFKQVRTSVYGLGSVERIGMISGPQSVEGVLRIASTSATLNGLTTDTMFQITAQLKHGATQMTVTFDECFLTEKSFAMAVGEHGEAVYGFTATRVREEQQQAAQA
jgi:hypothetical protein